MPDTKGYKGSGENPFSPKVKHECLSDRDCKTPGYVCRSNKCVDPCAGVSCPAGQQCSAGSCTACARGSASCKCPVNQVANGAGGCIDPCNPNTCPAATPTCARNGADRSCSCTSTSCGAGKYCSGGSCANTARNTQGSCPAGKLANGMGGCEAPVCTSDASCGGGKRCGNPGKLESYCYNCGPNESCNCPSGQVANGSGSCVRVACTDNNVCGAARECQNAGQYNAECKACAKGQVCGCPSGKVSDGSGNCASSNPCEGVTCTAGKKCVGGVCTNCANGEYTGCNCPNKTDSTTGQTYITVATGYGSCRNPCQSHTCKNSGRACMPPGPNEGYYYSASDPYSGVCQPCACNKDCDKFGYGSKCMKKRGSKDTFCYTPCSQNGGPGGWGNDQTGCWTSSSDAAQLFNYTKYNNSSMNFCGYNDYGGGGYGGNPYSWNGETCLRAYDSTTYGPTYTFTGVYCSQSVGYTSGGKSCVQYSKGQESNNVCHQMPYQKDYYSYIETRYVCGLNYDGGYIGGGGPSEEYGLPSNKNYNDWSGNSALSDYEELSTCPSGHPNSYY